MFLDRTTRLRDNPVQLNYGVAVTDVDGDGAFEMIVAGFGAPNLVLKWNDAAQQFENIADEVLADPTRQSIGVAAGDINGDGHEEIYILNTDTFAGSKRIADRLFLWRGRIWVDLFALDENRRALNLTAGRSVASLDRDGDGQYGFFVANYGGPMSLYELNDDGLLADVAQRAGVDLVTGGRGLVALPLVSDQMDVFAVNEMSPNFLFVNQGNGTFKEEAERYGLLDGLENGRGIAVVDANQDGQLDLVYGNWEGPHRLFVRTQDQNGRVAFRDVSTPEMALPSRVRTVIAADFDNDGYEEIFFNNIGEPNRLFGWRDGAWRRLDPGDALEPAGLGTGAAVGDFDGDGRLELLVSHGESAPQPLTYYCIPENDHDWLRVLPLTRFGAPARGAVVRLIMEDRVQVRAIDAGSGYLCQMEPVAHFGLGENGESVRQVEVRWPDGASITLDAPELNQLLRVPYPDHA
jgi:hypothetical protein